MTAKGMEGKRATARRTRGQEGKAHRRNENIIFIGTEHTHTHTQIFSEYRLVWFSLSRSDHFISIRVYVYMQVYHTHRHTHVLCMSLSRLNMCVIEREGGVPLSPDVCVRMSGGAVDENGGGEFECILELLVS